MIFVDSGAWFALLVPSDSNHPAATVWSSGNDEPLVTTDYVIDETLTLLRARGEPAKAIAFGNRMFDPICPVAVHYLTQIEIAVAWDVFRTFADKDWSFTDCTSRAAMEALGVATAFAFDRHFRQFGTVAVVP